MQNLIQNFRQSSIVFEKPGTLSEKWKTFTSAVSTKECSEFFYFVKILCYLRKLKKTWFYTFTEPGFLHCQDLDKAKNP